ncbi:uncharacterized protein BKCO1_500063 [Diplodia corticola]|uniref:Integral membrane protein n=1 Tax=Diplodia corticola TaxID=236234 RepID=A0A1J9SE71_9PEZI|nr:uncharacterized protein BKCO1_500063 [Diplodia corticola]OJD38124.1 hypothetical protein BKCO1_500063 [Diplodia corticola]
MDTSMTDTKVSSIAFGFFLGFGYLTAWDAYKITARNRNPWRSLFVWMVWGELAANTAIAILAWLFLEGVLPPTLPTFFFILLSWVFEIQFILQIIVNRVAIISMDSRVLSYIRWGTITFISLINISVFCIWLPAHLGAPEKFTEVNNVWDKITKVLIGLNDAALNWYFIDQVKKRLIANGLQKYNALARFNTHIILISVGMDVLIIGTMFLKNGAVFIQFHPVAYTVKLKIELSMTNLITRISKESISERNLGTTSTSHGHSRFAFNPRTTATGKDVALDVFQEQNHTSTVSAQKYDEEEHAEGLNQIYTKREVTVQVSDPQDINPESISQPSEHASSRSSKEHNTFHHGSRQDDEVPLSWRR